MGTLFRRVTILSLPIHFKKYLIIYCGWVFCFVKFWCIIEKNIGGVNMVHSWERNCANCWYYDSSTGYCDAQKKKVNPQSNCPEFSSKDDDD